MNLNKEILEVRIYSGVISLGILIRISVFSHVQIMTKKKMSKETHFL